MEGKWAELGMSRTSKQAGKLVDRCVYTPSRCAAFVKRRLRACREETMARGTGSALSFLRTFATATTRCRQPSGTLFGVSYTARLGSGD